MVQDTTLGSELYPASPANLFCEATAPPTTATNELKERNVYFVVQPPAESDWVDQSGNPEAVTADLSNLKLEESSKSAFIDKFPLGTKHGDRCLLLKVNFVWVQF